MKKKLLTLGFLVLCLCVLAGCQCEHEWTDADCLTAKVCTKCESTEGEPLGHSFAPATCAAPETCTRCGDIQGESLPHTYGEWILGETDMSHVCVNCGAPETTALDREVYLQQLLSGHWDCSGKFSNGKFDSAYKFTNEFLPYFSANTDGSAVLYNGEEIFCYTSITLESFEETDGIPSYTFAMTSEDQTLFYGFVSDLEDEDELRIFTSESDYIQLTKNRELAAAVEDTWAATENGRVYALTLNADRSISGGLGVEITGTWQLKPIYYDMDDGNNIACITLRYTNKDGKEYVVDFYQRLGTAGMTLERYLNQGGGSLFFFIDLNDDTGLGFRHMSEEDLAVLEAAMAEGNQKITGKWTSTEVHTWDSGSGTSDERSVTDYTITFAEDGTFTASLDQESIGTWEFDDWSVYDIGNGTEKSYSFNLQFDGVSGSTSASISNGSLYLSVDSKTVEFLQMTAEEWDTLLKGMELPVGSWIAVSANSWNGQTQKSTTLDASGCTLTVNADFTCSGMVDTAVSGTWYLTDYDSEYDLYSYMLSNGHIIGLENDGTLFYRIWDAAASTTISYEMQRS